MLSLFGNGYGHSCITACKKKKAWISGGDYKPHDNPAALTDTPWPQSHTHTHTCLTHVSPRGIGCNHRQRSPFATPTFVLRTWVFFSLERKKNAVIKKGVARLFGGGLSFSNKNIISVQLCNLLYPINKFSIGKKAQMWTKKNQCFTRLLGLRDLYLKECVFSSRSLQSLIKCWISPSRVISGIPAFMLFDCPFEALLAFVDFFS